MNELGNTPADKNYKPSGISKAEARIMEKQYNLGYQRGYEQAKKDLALAIEDVITIIQIIMTTDWYDFEINGKLWSKEFYEEVLKRFKEIKNGKD